LSDHEKKVGLIMPTHIRIYPENLVTIGPLYSDIMVFTVKKKQKQSNIDRTYSASQVRILYRAG